MITLLTLLQAPFLIPHGTGDTTVRPEQSARLNELLTCPHERKLWEGVGHGLHQEKAADVYAAIKAWFEKHKVLTN